MAYLGYSVVGISLDNIISDNERVNYIQGNAMNKEFLSKVLKDKYDGIVDFMSYTMENFPEHIELYLKNTGHYIFLWKEFGKGYQKNKILKGEKINESGCCGQR